MGVFKIKTIGVISLGLLLTTCKPIDVPDNPQELEGVPVIVMTYNIYGARPAFGLPPANLPEIAAVINKYKPDLVALQEVDVFTRRSGVNVNQADSLAKLTGMHCFFAKAIDKDGGSYGDAVLSRHEIIKSTAYKMGVDDRLGGEMRSVAMVKITISGKTFNFASTHLDHLSDETNRIYQANELKTIVESIEGNLILGGDFNATPTSQTMSVIKGYMTLGCKSCSPTYPSNNPARTIDYIMFKPLNNFIIQNYMVVDEPYASDHCPVISIIRVK
jgi:endonuclease/exonuclease/phosphatase family metal-dependent hydrolase